MTNRRNDMWDSFAKTGRVADYLRYKGVDVFDAETGEAGGAAERGKRRHDHRRPDHKGK